MVNIDTWFQEQLDDLAVRVADLEWTELGDAGENGVKLHTLKQVTPAFKDAVGSNFMLVRAHQLLTSLIWGKGVAITELDYRTKRVLQTPSVISNIITMEARHRLISAILTEGNIFMAVSQSKQHIHPIPMGQITEVVYNPDDATDIWWLKRWWNTPTGMKTKWYRTPTTPNQKQRTYKGVPVETAYTVVHATWNRPYASTFGIPMVFSSLTWVKAYSSYLKNNALLVKAYATIAHKITTPQKAPGASGAVEMVQKNSVGGVVASSGEFTALPATGSQVNFNNGRALAAAVAGPLGLEVNMLLGDPGVSGGTSDGLGQLIPATHNVMSMLQSMFQAFLLTVLKNLGVNTTAEGFTVAFPSIETDATYRQLASLSQAYGTGAIHQIEYRRAVLSVLDVPEPLPVAKLPEPDAFNSGKIEETDTEGTQSNDPNPRQGNSGYVPGGLNFDGNDARDAGEYEQKTGTDRD